MVVAFLVNSLFRNSIAVDAVGLHPLTLSPTDAALGTNADAWFVALDGHVVRVGDDTGILRIDGIHGQGSTLWIQASLFDDDVVPGVVLQVEACHGQRDVFERLRDYERTGLPLEIIKL
jgi:hypothetical protein